MFDHYTSNYGVILAFEWVTVNNWDVYQKELCVVSSWIMISVLHCDHC